MNKISFIIEFDEVSKIQEEQLIEFIENTGIKFQVLESDNDLKKYKKYKEVIDKLNDAINKMIHTGYLVEKDNGAIQFMATSEKSEFGTRAIVLLDILKEVE